MPKIPIPFPLRGLDENANHAEQSPATASDMLNVRSHDALLERLRGGRRPGLSKFFPTEINGSNEIQDIAEGIFASAVDGESVSQQQVLFAGTGFNAAPFMTNAARSLAGAVGVTYDAGNSPDGRIGKDFDFTPGFYFVSFVRSSTWPSSGGAQANIVKTNAGSTNFWHVDLGLDDTANDIFIAYHPASNRLFAVTTPTAVYPGSGGAVRDTFAFHGDDGTLVWSANNFSTGAGSTPRCMDVDDDGNLWVVDVRSGTSGIKKIRGTDGAVMGQWTADATQTNVRDVIFNQYSRDEVLVVADAGTDVWDGGDNTIKNFWILNKDTLAVTLSLLLEPSLGAQLRTAPLPNGNIIIGSTAGTEHVRVYDRLGATIWTFNVSGTGTIDVAGDVDGHVWSCGPRNNTWTGSAGAFAALWKLNGGTGAVLLTEDFGAVGSAATTQIRVRGILREASLSGRGRILAIVSGGTIHKLDEDGALTIPTGGTSALTTDSFKVQSANGFSRIFYVDGTNSETYDILTDIVSAWTAIDFPDNARLVTRYRGRMVLAGFVDEPHNWFMSRVGDPFDWDTSQTDALAAVAGNNSEAGLMGDLITALIPFSDDAMLFGGDRSIWMMAGDPAAGGSIDLITDDTGIAWDAWTKDPNGTLYFLGIDGVYRMTVGGKPENMTQHHLNRRFKAFNLSSRRGILAWDYLRKGLYVVLAHAAGSEVADVLFWNQRTDSWSREQFASSIGPTVLFANDASLPDDKALLFGGNDGFIRKLDDDAEDDDGNTLDSLVRTVPISIGQGTAEARLTELEVQLAEDSGPVDLKIFTGQTAEQCAASTTPRFARTMQAGRNVVAVPRVSAAYLQFQLGQTAGSTRWALERMNAMIEPGGRPRRLRRG